VGGIGSGKSRVADTLARRGGRLVSGDDLAHQALRQPALREKIVSRWGRDLLDDNGEILRKKLAAIVFKSAEDRSALERIVHPWIVARIEEEVARARADAACPFIVLDAAILLEAGWQRVCDRLVYVDAPREVRLRRIAAQRGWTETELADREAAQLPLTRKRECADHVIDNSATLEDLERQVDTMLARWGLARGATSG